MARKRMFSEDIVESDAFLSLSKEAQLLYFHLNMRADDEGFVNNIKLTETILGVDPTALQELYDKRFLIQFPAVSVIKGWLMNNAIRNDRIKKTNYDEERKQLTIKPNGSYKLVKKPQDNKQMPTLCGQVADTLRTNCGQNGAQISIDKISIGKTSIDKDKEVCSEVQTLAPLIELPMHTKSHKITQKDIDHYQELYPLLDIVKELNYIKEWLDDHPTKQSYDITGSKKRITRWLKNDQQEKEMLSHKNTPPKKEIENIDINDDFNLLKQLRAEAQKEKENGK